MLNFMNPFAFLFLLFIPVVYALRKIGLFVKPAFPIILSDWQGTSFKWNGKFFKLLAFLKSFLVVAGYIFVVFAFAEPVIHHEERVYTSRGNDVMFVLDVSPSMAAKDMDGGTRFEAAKRVIHYLVSQNSGSSFGLVGMSSEAILAVPPTTDKSTFIERMNALSIGTLGEGSAIGTGLSMAVYHLSTSKAPSKCIILLTDGENNAGSVHPETAAELAVEYGITIYAVGIGTRGNVPLEYTNPVTGKVSSGFLDSMFDTKPLQKLALITGGRYFNGTNINELSGALNSITNHERVVQSYQLKTIDDYFFDEMIILAALCFALAWIISCILLKESFE
ncbi:MAG: VWA domain-containing protein [Treponema sp.]|nr:VWA domain-containing protein [Treponema sp.]